MKNKKTKSLSLHDSFFRKAMGDLRIARDFFEQHLPENVKKRIDLNSLQIEEGTFVQENLRRQIADILYQVESDSGKGYLYLLVEHKSSYQELTPFAVQKYIYAIMEKYQHPKTKALPLVMPIVVYHGEKAYDGPTDVRDLIDAPRDWIDTYYAKPFHLIDLNLIKDEELRSQKWAGIYQLLQKHIRTRNALSLLKSIETSLLWFEKQGAASFVEAVLNYALEAGIKESRIEFIEEVRKILSPPIGGKMISIADSLREEGWQEGRQEGRQEGAQLKQRTIAEKMLAQGYDAKNVASIVGLPLVAVEKLQSESIVAL